MGDYKAAIADQNKAIRLRPDYADAYENRGQDRQALGDTKGAIADYQQAAQLFEQQGKTAAAQRAKARARALKP